MASKDQFLEVVKLLLDKKGHLAKIRAEIRSMVMVLLSLPESENIPNVSEDVLFINELIREYFKAMKYDHSFRMLSAEAGMNPTMASHKLLVEWLDEDGNENNGKPSTTATSDDESEEKNKPLLLKLLKNIKKGHF